VGAILFCFKTSVLPFSFPAKRATVAIVKEKVSGEVYPKEESLNGVLPCSLTVKVFDVNSNCARYIPNIFPFVQPSLPNPNFTVRSGPDLPFFELLIVIATIAILAGRLPPALSSAKSRAQSIDCLTILKECQVAWLLYAADFMMATRPLPEGPKPSANGGILSQLHQEPFPPVFLPVTKKTKLTSIYYECLKPKGSIRN
jgi:hypothetical protein